MQKQSVFLNQSRKSPTPAPKMGAWITVVPWTRLDPGCHVDRQEAPVLATISARLTTFSFQI